MAEAKVTSENGVVSEEITSQQANLIKHDSFFKKFSKHKLATISFFILLIEVLIVVFAPMIFDIDPYSLDVSYFAKGPNSVHLLGTDEVGRDILARMIYGGRVSLFVGIASMAISVLIGLPLGLIAGYFRGISETLLMRCVDVFQSFPAIIMILVLVAIFGPSISTVTIVIGVMGWVQPAKLIYGATLSVSDKEYIESARSIGYGNTKILFTQVLPNVVSPLWINMAFRVSRSMIMESSLSFLGAGVQPPQASWGNIIYAAQNNLVLTTKPWIWVPPGIALVITIIAINLIGEGIRDALDPKMKR